jgi:hypothetical protein
MKLFKIGVAAIVLQMSLMSVLGHGFETNIFNAIRAPIPDGSSAGIQDIRVISSEIVELTTVRVRLKILGNFNGDLYGYIRHTNAQSTHIAILVNRPGKTSSDLHGYSDDGLDVTLADAAATDIHNYQVVSIPPDGSPLTGVWQPDARFVDPIGVMATSPRSAFLNAFNGLNASGEWTLFLADMDPGATNMLESWGLELVGKVSPVITWAAPTGITYGTPIGLEQLNATAEVAGTFSYSPPAGTVLNAGTQTLAVTFVPDDTNQYVVAVTNVVLQVSAQPLTITAGSTNKTYGQVVTFSGTEFVALGLTNGDTVSSVTLTSAGTSATASQGSYSIVPSTATGSLILTNYDFSYVPGVLSVQPASLIAKAENQTRFYGQTNPVLTINYTGFVNGENASIVSGSGPSTLADTNSPIGPYVISLSGQTAQNYSVTNQNGTLTIAPAPLLVAADNVRRAYGLTNPVLTATITGLANGEDTNVLDGNLVLSTVADSLSTVGVYSIVPSGLTSTNYAIQFTNGMLTVTPYALVVTADNTNRLYGAPNPNFTGTVETLQNGDNISVTYATPATPSSPVGDYAIVPSLDDPDGRLTNYSVTLNSGLLTVAPAALTCRVANESRPYGQTNPVFTMISTGFVNGDDASIVTGPAPTTLADSHSPIGSYPITLSTQSAPNYSITHVNGTLTIDPTPLVIAAADARRVQGETNPTFSATFTGLANGENTNVLSGTLLLTTTADQNSLTGTYPIVPSGLTSTNYAIVFTNGTLTVTPYGLVVTADNATRNYGATDPTFTGSVVGLQEGDNITTTYTTAATALSPVGDYEIVPLLDDPDGKLTNYTVTLNKGVLTVEAAPLTARVQNQSRLYGQSNPLFPISYEGFVNGEGPSVVSGPTFGSTTAVTNSPAGNYPITVTGQSAPNYQVDSVNGSLTVQPAPLIVAANNARRARNSNNPTFTANISGFVNNEDTNVLGGTLLLTTTADQNSQPGTYPIVPSGLTSTNYAIVFTNGILTVTPYALVVSANSTNRTYGGPNPVFTGSMVGLHGGDNITAVYTTTATPASSVNVYSIVPSLDDPGNQLTNYTVTLQNGLLTVQPAPLQVTANATNRACGQTNPIFTATISGLMDSEGVGVLSGTLVLSTLADIQSTPGTYSIVPSGLTATNYAIQFINGQLTVNKAASIAALASSANPALPHSNVLFTASLTELPPGPFTPSGSVQFKVDGANYGVPMTLVNGSVVLTTSTLPWGSHNVSLEYQGDSNFLGSTNALSVPQIMNTPPVANTDNVGRAATRGTKIPVANLLANDSDPDLENVVFDSVSSSSSSNGTVKLANGWILYTPPPGFANTDSFTYTIRDGLGGIGVGMVTVTPRASETVPRMTLAKSVNPVRRLTVSGPPWATYSFDYTDSLRPASWQTLTMSMADGAGHLEVIDDSLPVPARRFYHAHYLADFDAVLPLWFTLTSSANPADPGSLLILTATLTPIAPGSGSPSGTVQFKVDGANYGSPVSVINGVASLSTSTLSVGVHNISAEYSGDDNFSSSTTVLIPAQAQVINTPPDAGAFVLERASSTGTKLPVSSLLGSSSDADGQSLIFDGITSKTTEGGTLELTDGWIYYTPPPGSPIGDSFNYTIHDSLNASAVGTVSITTVVGNEVTPNLTVLDLGAGNYRILFSGVPWRTYSIQFSQTLPGSNWQVLASRTADSHGQFEYDDTLPAGTSSRFYRAVDQNNALTASPFRFSVWTNFIAQTNSRTMDMWSTRFYPDGWPAIPPVLAWNTNCLLYDREGFTGISQSSEFEGAPGQIPVTLVTRRHGFMRGHGNGPVGLQTTGLAGKKLWFCTASNTLVEMTIAAQYVRLGQFSDGTSTVFYDYGLVIFTQDVPDSITPLSIISPTDFEIYYYRTAEIPYFTLGTEQDGHCAAAGDPIPPFIYPLNKGGDSGSPNFLLSPDNKLIMFSGRGVSGFSPQVQADIDTLTLYSGLNTNNYRLRYYNLSPWAP